MSKTINATAIKTASTINNITHQGIPSIIATYTLTTKGPATAHVHLVFNTSRSHDTPFALQFISESISSSIIPL